MQIVAADVGNSSIKLMRGVVNPGQQRVSPVWQNCRSIDARDLDDGRARKDLRETRGPDLENVHWFVSSVNARNTLALQALAGANDAMAGWNEITHTAIQLRIDVDQPDTVGIDRLLAAQAAGTMYASDRDAIVIDCGTALTIDLVTRDQCFRGGVIMAGPQTNLRALSSMTSALPDLSGESIQRPRSMVGRSTRDALLSGAYLNGLGAIREVVARFTETLPCQPVVVGTGGGLGPWRDDLPDSWIVVENLVIEGLFQIALRTATGRARP